jgi:predicted Rdx family selenoprotein
MIKNVLGVETTLTPGGRGEYTVWVDGAKVADKAGGDFPTEVEVVTAVQNAVRPSTPPR